MNKIINKIDTPADLKNLKITELNTLAQEIRELIINKVNTIGGHMGPNLGFVEPTIVMHKIFNSPKDKIIFDVSHQCYTHKILTGRKNYFLYPEKYLEISGYTNPKESEHDVFVVGHTSTSISLALGVAKARDLKNENYNVIAVIGDGSLSGGEAYEGLNNASMLKGNFIIVINDNEMSIAKNQGGLYQNLKLLRETNGKAECNFFKSLGFDYFYLEEGNNIEKLTEIFAKIKDIDHPTILHIHTLKGKGLKIAEENKEAFHWIMAGTLNSTENIIEQTTEDYYSLTTDYILKKNQTDKKVIAINPATPGAIGFSKEFREKLGENYIDVGIAEEHAVAYASGLAKNGAKPILAMLSSFSQRTYDQLSQDLALNNSPATILIFWGGISPADMTHLGCFDIPLISNIPNIVYLAPTCKEEYLNMLDWSVEQNQYPVAIRVPFGDFITTNKKDFTDYSILNKFKIEEEGKEIAIIALGNFFEFGRQLKKIILEQLKINATLINPKFISGLDKKLLNQLKNNHKIVITLENGLLDGGFGQKIASFYGDSNIKVLNYGAKKEFPDRVDLNNLFERYNLTPEKIIKDINL